MALQATCIKKVFQFNFKARTSRGLMPDKTSWFIKLWDDQNPSVVGYGECGPLPGLSVDAHPEFESKLTAVLSDVREKNATLSLEELSERIPHDLPSVLFGLETAMLDLKNGGRRVIYNNSFIQGTPIDINGLIWMGDMDFMMTQINEKVAKGFTCIKLKVGGLDFDRECDVLRYLRRRFYKDKVTIRLDANGAFKIDDALFKLNELAQFDIHSIEQPIKPGLEVMEELCRRSPIPVAFDEELIGIKKTEREKLLKKLRPQYIILKPTLHGGLSGSADWIRIAEQLGMGWWITSALESNIGLNAVSQFAANYNMAIPQGLGTGAIYENNIPSPLTVSGGKLTYDPKGEWDLTLLNS
jgi:o-succinylbenzoate synthase